MRRVLLIAALLLAAAAPAQAVTVSVDAGTLTIHGGSEDNTLNVAPSGANVRVVDTTGGANAGAGCNVVNATTVDCAAAQVTASIVYDLGTGVGYTNMGAVGVSVPLIYKGSPDEDRINSNGYPGPSTIDLGVGPHQAARTGIANDKVIIGDGADDVDTNAGDDELDASATTIAMKVTLDGVANDEGGGDNIGTHIERITLGSGRDVLSPPSFAVKVNGGAGDDVLTGSSGNDELDGGVGDDAISPGDGNDVARGGPGDDGLIPSKGADVLDGGEGTLDAIAYGTEPVTVTLDDAANDGENDGAEGDNLLGIEVVSGSSKSDHITGNAVRNQLYGGPGNDVIEGGAAVDVIRGGLDDDVLGARDAQLERDDVGCDAGTDSVVSDANDVVASDCEANDRAAAPPGVDPGQLGPGGVGPGTFAAGPGAGTSGPAAGAAAPDTTPAKLSLKGVPGRTTKAKLAKGLTVSVSSNEAVALDVRLVGTSKRATIALNDDVTLARATAKRAGGTRKLKLKPARSLLRGARRLNVLVVAIDAGGNRTTLSRTLRLK